MAKADRAARSAGAPHGMGKQHHAGPHDKGVAAGAGAVAAMRGGMMTLVTSMAIRPTIEGRRAVDDRRGEGIGPLVMQPCRRVPGTIDRPLLGVAA